METITGTVKNIIYESQQNDFKVFVIKRPDNSLIRVTGDFTQILSGAKLEVHGDFKSHPKYGPAFKATAHTFCYDKNTSSISLYIQMIAKWVGPVRSYAIAEKFGGDLQDVIEKTPERLMEIEGIGEKVAESIVEAWKLNRDMKDIQIFLYGLGLGVAKVRRITNMFGPDTEKILTENPWMLCGHGFGFTTCDNIAHKLGRDMRDPFRYQQFINYTMNQVVSTGHLYLHPAQIVEAFNRYNAKADYPFKGGDLTIHDIAVHIKTLIQTAYLLNDNNRIYSLSSFFFENESARLISKILNTKSSCKLNAAEADAYIKRYEENSSIGLPVPFKLSVNQIEAVRSFFIEKVMIMTGGPGTGKCLGKNTPVLMYDGTVKLVQDITIGELLMGDDSTPRRVLSLARGEEQMYRVTPTKGDPYEVNESHILSLRGNGDRSYGGNKIHDVSVKEYLQFSSRKRHHLKGYRVPVDFEHKEVPLDPYLIGFWLGNGGQDSTAISTPFPEVIEFIKLVVKPFKLFVIKHKGDNVDYNISRDIHDGSYNSLKKPNHFLNVLRDLQIINDKHIPDLYKCNSRENRLRLLAGLIDSDGCSDQKGAGFDVCFKSKKLAEQTIYVARSLGFAAYLKKTKKRWTSPNQKNKYSGEGIYYRFFISGDGLEDIPIISEKRKPKLRLQKKNVLNVGIKVEPIGVGDYYGFEIDGNRRFLLGDFTVTHNTQTVKAFVQVLREKGISFELLTPTGIAAKKLGNATGGEAYTIHRRLGYKGNTWDSNSTNKYSTDVIIIDECSMVDQEVFYRLISAIYPSTKIVFVGDNDQLPSVGPGCVLRELIDSKLIKTIFLDKIFRQDKCSEIILESKKIRDGDTDLTYFRSEPTSDIWHIADKDDTRIENTIISFAKQLKNRAKEKHNITFQIITPRNEGPLSVFSLNAALQKALNPPDPNKSELRIDEAIIRVGDRVLVKKNNYEHEVFNGDVGKVISITPSSVVVDIEDFMDKSKRIDLPINLAEDMLKLAYVITVHKCLPKGTLVYTSMGAKRIESISCSDLVYTHMGRYKRVVWSGQTNDNTTIEFVTKTGSCYNTSPEHGLLVSNGGYPVFKEAKEVKVGEYICCSRIPIEGVEIPIEFKNTEYQGKKVFVNLPPLLDEDLSWVIGVIIGDGSCTDRDDGSIEVAGPTKPTILERFNKIINGYGVNTNSHKRNGVEYTTYICSKNLRDFFYSIGIDYVIARYKKIPEIFYTCKIKERCSFIAGLFDTDGSVNKMGMLRYRTASVELAYGLKKLLHSVGIVSFVKKEKEYSFLVSVFGVDSIKFREIIKLTHPKKRKLLEDYKIFDSGKTNHYSIPYGKDIVEQFLSSFQSNEGKSRGIKGKGLLSRYGSIYKRCRSVIQGVNEMRYPLLYALENICRNENIEIPPLMNQCLSDIYYFDKIISKKENTNRVAMYDLEVEEDHSYTTPDFICHNSQGSEYSIVILPLIKAHGTMLLQRNLLYTAITRAKKKVILIGQTSAIEQAIRNDKIQKRNTVLSERINKWMSGTGISMRNIFSQLGISQSNEILERLLSLEEGSK